MIYITGANGRIGSAIFRAIPNSIAVVRRSIGSEREVVSDYSFSSLKNIFSDADTIIHAAGSTNFASRESLFKSNVDLVKKVCLSAPRKVRLILISSVSVYGKSLNGPATEDTPINPDSYYAESKAKAEKIVGNYCFESTILRVGPAYGPEFSDFFFFLSMAEKGLLPIIGEGKNRICFVHSEDIASAVSSAVDAEPGTYNIAGFPETQETIIKTAYRLLGTTSSPPRIPYWAARFVGAFGEKLSVFLKRAPITKEHIEVLFRDRVFDIGRAIDFLGFIPRKIDAGISEMVKLYSERGAVRT